MPKPLFLLLQYIVPQVLLTRFAAWVATRRSPRFKNSVIAYFVKRYHVDLSLAASETIESYPTFNDFFIRALKPSARPLAEGKNILVSPVDGCISQIGTLHDKTLLQAKGHYYSVNALLGKEESEETPFKGGFFATFYLSPKDYHRVHLPLEGRLIQTTYCPGKLFSVNPLAAAHIPNLFTRNERLVCLFETALGPFAVILIGAMIVGKIETVWGAIERSKTLLTRHYSDQEARHFSKGAELGRFLLGSSVILLAPPGSLQWRLDLKAQSPVQMGQALGEGRIQA